MELYSVATMQEAERRAGTEYGISLTTLMDRAGKGLARAVLDMADTMPGVVGVFCGSGNNGGDGYVCARELLRAGLAVTVYAAGPPHPGGLAFGADEDYRTAGGVVVPADTLTSVPDDAALVVDCLLGTGLARPVAGSYARLITLINQSPAPVLACDVPSGVNSDDGAVMGIAVEARRTLMMGLAKPACVLPPGCDCFGDVEIRDIGLPPALVSTLAPLEVSGRRSVPVRWRGPR